MAVALIRAKHHMQALAKVILGTRFTLPRCYASTLAE